MITARDFKIEVDPCIDVEDTWVWSLLDFDNGCICYDYASSPEEALREAKRRRAEWVDYLNGNETPDQQGG